MRELIRGAGRTVRWVIPAFVALAACSRAKEAPKIPLEQMKAAQPPAATAATPDQLSGTARAALDSGNTSFRAGRFAAALASYRRAANDAPQSAAPYFGIYMAAKKLGNRALADSASREIQRREGTAPTLNDSAMRQLHAGGAPRPKS